MCIKIAVFRMIDYAIVGDTSHTSISGGIATHNFYEVGDHKVDSFDEVLPKIKDVYGCIPYIFDDRLEFQESDTSALSFYLTEITEIPLDNDGLKITFPTLKEN